VTSGPGGYWRATGANSEGALWVVSDPIWTLAGHVVPFVEDVTSSRFDGSLATNASQSSPSNTARDGVAFEDSAPA
jgi:hypothetical protein